MDKEALWDKFTESGMISDYLDYAALKDNSDDDN